MIFVCNLRVIGAALATIIAQIIVTLVFLYDAKKLDLFQEIKLLSKPDKNHISKILKIGFPPSIQSMLFTCISMYIARLISSFGAISVAVQKVGSQIESISWMAADGFSASINAFTSQNYGAKNYNRVQNGIKLDACRWFMGIAYFMHIEFSFLVLYFLVLSTNPISFHME